MTGLSTKLLRSPLFLQEGGVSVFVGEGPDPLSTFVSPVFSVSPPHSKPSAFPVLSAFKAQRSGFESEKEEGAYGYGVFAALSETAETEWSKLLLTRPLPQ